MTSMVEIVGCAPAVDKSDIFVCLFVIDEVVITETLLNSVIFKTVMIPLHRGRFLVVHHYSSYSMNPWIFP